MEIGDYKEKIAWLHKNTPYNRRCDLVIVSSCVYLAHNWVHAHSASIKITKRDFTTDGIFVKVNDIRSFTRNGYVLTDELNAVFSKIEYKKALSGSLTYSEIRSVKASMLEHLYDSKAVLSSEEIQTFDKIYQSIKKYNEILVLDEYPIWMT